MGYRELNPIIQLSMAYNGFESVIYHGLIDNWDIPWDFSMAYNHL